MSTQSKRYQKFVATAAAATLVASTMPIAASAATYSDVPSNLEKAVEYLTEQGIAQGYKESFGTSESIKRGDAAIMIAKAIGLNVSGAPKSPFKDMNARVAGAVNALFSAGIISGKTKTTFAPDDLITRAEMAKVLANAYKLDGAGVKNTFNDVNDNWDSYVNALLKSGITKGKTTTTFGADSELTRGEMALFIYRAKDIDLPETEPFELSLMHTNDTHAHLDNVAKRITAIKEVRASKPDALLLDAGDVFSGTLYFNEFQGQADLAFMNLAKYDMMTLGNHEFDLGSTPEGHQALAKFIKDADFPIVSSNVNFSADANLKDLFNSGVDVEPKGGEIQNTVIKNVNGQKIGFIGLTTEETAQISSANDVKFKDYITSANAAVDALESQGVNKIIAISHLGFDDNPAFDNDQLLAKNVDGIDVIVGGHSHTQLNAPVEIKVDEKGVAKDPTIIVQGYQFGDYLGTLDVTFDKNGVVTGNLGTLIKVADKTEDAEAAALLVPYAEKISALKNTETGASATTALTNPRLGDASTESVRANETRLGNLIADGMLWKAKQYDSKAVIAMQNGGGIRAPIDAGAITLGDVLTTLPFGNTLATMKLTGAEIKEALEHSVSLAPLENGGFLHISGMKFSFDSSKAAGERVTLMQVKNTDGTFTDINLATEYVIATNAFTAKGGDGFTVFKKAYEAGRVTDLGAADWENLRDYVKLLGTVNPQVEGRILSVK